MTRSAPADHRHVPVLLERVVEVLAPAVREPGSVVVDATLGLGGHAQALLDACPEATLVGIDRDAQARDAAGERLPAYGD
ncbi:16S rRNA (cytosine(1402)-N(4))-methyltransferase, partial [Nostocoides australiense]|uniref:16S rRNA (cytosine(1402)-N(4))-methyltransferase n=1 Tax=Nostocoides australiense TaxID=99480 RepID=UPI0009FB22BF